MTTAVSHVRNLITSAAALIAVALGLAGCGSSVAVVTTTTADAPVPQGRPQAIEPAAGQQAAAVTATDPVGDPTAHAPPLSQVKAELKLEFVAAKVTNATYVDPLQYVTHWERTDQGVDANMPVGAPILAPCKIKILNIEPDWNLTQPLVFFELLEGPDAGKVQFVAEEITDIAPPATILERQQAIARYAAKGTGIEYAWSTLSGVTL